MNKVLYCKKAVLIPAVIAVMVAGGCSSDDDNDEIQSHAVTLKFQVSEAPLENPEAPAASTRTAETTTASFESFNFRYVVDDELSNLDVSATKNERDGLWTASSGWPRTDDDNTLVSFYAYANTDNSSSVSKDNNKVYLNFTVDETTSHTKDLLVATASDTRSHSNGVIGFRFSHACGALRFSLSKTSGLKDYTVLVKSVIIHNIPSSGRYCFNDGTWTFYTDVNDKKDFTIKSYDGNAYLEVRADKEYLSDEGDYLFLLPQELTAWNKSGAPANAYVEIVCKISIGGNYVVGGADSWGNAYLPLNINIAQGKINPVHISMGTALRKSDGSMYFNGTSQ